jgi:AcrR family transcriptional regulator
MAIDVERLVMEELLELVEQEGEQLERITVKRLLERTGVARQTFYNHFLDKFDLICRTYDKLIISEFEPAGAEFDFRASLLASCERMCAHGTFMRQACAMSGQNCLRDHLFEHSRAFDLAWHQQLWGDEPMPEALRFATEYHADASTSMALSWILSGFPVPAEELVDLTVHMRALGMDHLFADAPGGGNPYVR